MDGGFGNCAPSSKHRVTVGFGGRGACGSEESERRGRAEEEKGIRVEYPLSLTLTVAAQTVPSGFSCESSSQGFTEL